MDNFDLKKYLQHNPLLEQKSEEALNDDIELDKFIKVINEDCGCGSEKETINEVLEEETINEILDEKNWKCRRCGSEITYTIFGKRYCEPSGLKNKEFNLDCPNSYTGTRNWGSEFISLNESINENNPEYVIDADEFLRLINVYKNQYDPVISEGKAKNLCVLTIGAITNIIATFPKFFADLGPEGIRIFVYSLFDGKKDSMIPFFDYVQRNEPTDDKIWNLRTHPLIRVVKGTASASMGLLSAMIAVALKLIEKTAKIGCLSVLGLDAAGSMAKLAIRVIESGGAGVDHSDKDGRGYIKFMKKMRKGK
jgi:hypothetical protein